MEDMSVAYDAFRALGWSAKETWQLLIEQSFETETTDNDDE